MRSFAGNGRPGQMWKSAELGFKKEAFGRVCWSSERNLNGSRSGDVKESKRQVGYPQGKMEHMVKLKLSNVGMGMGRNSAIIPCLT